jgi:hypothetical protein
VLAAEEDAASAVVAVDLAARPEQTDLTIKLDIDGTIAGLVVDAHGQAVAGAQVSALPELGSNTDVSELRLRGPAADVSDAGGAFKLGGLAPGKYRLRATRAMGDANPDFWMNPGTVAEAGQKDVRLTLDEGGTVKGKVMLATGYAPALFQVSTSSFGTSTPFTGGADFRLDNVPVGKRTLSITGPGFTKKLVEDVDVKAGEETDVGTITVERGRLLRGTVYDRSGSPVADAKVMAGARVIGDGSGIGNMPFPGAALKTATSADDGSFELPGIGPQAVLVVADGKPGRSRLTPVPAGADDATVTLTLDQVGALTGKVVSQGKPVPGAMILAQQQGTSRGQFIVTAGQDGSFRFDKLAPGDYLVSAMMHAGMMGGDMTQAAATVKAEATVDLTIDVPAGGVQATVKVTPAVDNAVVLLASGALQAKNLGELEVLMGARQGGGAVHQSLIVGAAMDKGAIFQNVTRGDYTACAAPIQGSLMDPRTTEKLQKNPDALPVFCQPVAIGSSAAIITIHVK